MASTYLWHQLHLHRFKTIGLFLLLWQGVSFTSFGQQISIRKNLLNHDVKPMHYGFYLGINSSRYLLTHSNYYVQNQRDTMSVNPEYSPGFTIGFVLNRRLSEYVDLRLVPGVGFYSRTVEFRSTSNSIDQAIGSTSLEFPLLFKFKSKRRGNIRVYFVGGAKVAADIGNKKNGLTSEELEVLNQDFTLEYGVGTDLFFPYFKFSPELRFSNGLTNRFSPAQNPYSRSVRNITSNTVTLYLNFEN